MLPTILKRSTRVVRRVPPQGSVLAAVHVPQRTPQQVGLLSTWIKEKADAKEKRRQLYAKKVDRREKLKTRRKGAANRGGKRKEFRHWFIERKVNEEYMNRKARQAGLDWKIRVATIVERNNVVLPDIQDWELDFMQLSAKVNLGKDYPPALFQDEEDEDEFETEEEAWESLKERGFEPLPRETEADKTGDTHTLDRKLKESIFLVVKEKGRWWFPTVDLNQDETVLDAGKRAVGQRIGDDLDYWCPGNGPMAVDMTAYEDKSEHYGEKTFFMRFEYTEGELEDKDIIEDYQWLDRSEIMALIKAQDGDKQSKFMRYLL